MKVLALETSGALGSVALLECNRGAASLLSEQRLPCGQRTARSLLPAVKAMLAEQSWRPADVQLVAVATGPGSFTGLRIGVVAAKTFAYATGAGLVGVHTLAAIAAGVGHWESRLWTVLDAQRGELFVAVFEQGQPLDELRPHTEIMPAGQWLAALKPGDVVAGPPMAKLRAQLPAGVTAADEATWSPMAGAVGRLGADLWQRHGGVSPMELVPNYYRRSAAEEKAARK